MVQRQSDCNLSVWALPKMPPNLAPLLKMAEKVYIGGAGDTWEDLGEEAKALVQYMERRIEDLVG
ncbi:MULTISPECIES: aminoglycoside adenylyltransferase domain-containing protein [Hungatella]|uniref:aminoglycoside adenylyltransferase domain-containing protein n=1 Tax=Hungatella TaxID=1649459 RepID=UPI00241EE316|nr:MULTISPECIES: aminoglycoside adenylyltransferase domain-containing protein [Hungatella]MDU0931549.1 DUF4111 domain-containing protein [Hungatella hathewayi]